VYRFWRDMGYAAGGLIAGAMADALGFGGAIAVVAGLTAASGLWVAFDLRAGEGHTDQARRAPRGEPMLVDAGGPSQTMLQRVPAGEGDDLI